MQRSELDRIRHGIAALRTAEPSTRETFWGGAEVMVTPERIPENPDAFYPPPQQVVTDYPSEVTWLFESLRDLMNPLIDSISKFAFYGSLADAASQHNQWSEIRNAMLDAAEGWLDEAESHVEQVSRDPRIH